MSRAPWCACVYNNLGALLKNIFKTHELVRPPPPLVLHANNDTIAAASATNSLTHRSKKWKRGREKAGPGDGHQYANPRVLVKLYARLRNGRTFAVRAVTNFHPGEERVSYVWVIAEVRVGCTHTKHTQHTKKDRLTYRRDDIITCTKISFCPNNNFYGTPAEPKLWVWFREDDSNLHVKPFPSAHVELWDSPTHPRPHAHTTYSQTYILHFHTRYVTGSASNAPETEVHGSFTTSVAVHVTNWGRSTPNSWSISLPNCQAFYR